MRIVSLLPSATELVAALGMADKLVGRSHECDWPDGFAHLPVLTAPKLNPQAEAATIDKSVRALVEQGVSVYRLDADQIKRLAPDFVITQSQCELCAVSLAEVAAALQDWVEGTPPPQLISLEPMRLADIFTDIAKLAKALQVEAKGAQLIAAMQAGFAALDNKLHAKLKNTPRPKVFFMEWSAPLMGAGNWIPEIIIHGGGAPLLGHIGEHSPVVNWDDIEAANPDVIIIGPCGFNIERTRFELAALEKQPRWQSLRAVRKGAVYLVDGNFYFNRPSPRLLDSAQIIAEILHPDLCPAAPNQMRWVQHG
ncbi:MAG: cobalamin-binding protein [Parvibaculales bacterium]